MSEYSRGESIGAAILSQEVFQGELERRLAAARAGSTPLSVIMCDLDNFKTINDVLGHSRGDAVLADAHDVAVVLSSQLRHEQRRGDTGADVGRIGGDEFSLLVDTDYPGAGVIRNRLIASFDERFDEPQHAEPRRLLLGLSVGISTLQKGDSAADLMHRADRDMHERKKEHAGEEFKELDRDTQADLQLVNELLKRHGFTARRFARYEPLLDERMKASTQKPGLATYSPNWFV